MRFGLKNFALLIFILTSLSVPSSKGIAAENGNVLRLDFSAVNTEISETQKQKIEDFILSQTGSRASIERIKILSFATKATGQKISARRISWLRALNVRAAILGKNIEAQQIDIFPMGAEMPPPVTDHITISVTKK